MNLTSFTTLCLCGSILSACSVYKTEFECDPVSGVSCKSLSQINELYEQGKLGDKEFFDETPSLEASNLPFFKGSMMRTPESIQRIWLAGYEDSEGTYHGPKYIYTVTQKSHWAPKVDSKGDNL